MSNQTLQRPKQQRIRPSARRQAGRAGSYRKQTARLEGRRDGKPLVTVGRFRWGQHLTRAQKNRYQHLGAYSFLGVVVLAVIGTLAFGALNENYLIPNQTIVKVNSVNISQDTYRKHFAYKAQVLWNTLQKEITQQNSLAAAVQAHDPAATQQNQVLTAQIQSDEGNYSQAALSQSAMDDLVENQLIVSGAHQMEQQYHLSASTFEPSDKAVKDAFNTFKANFPHSEKYSSFLSADKLSDADITNSVKITLRRTMMQTWLAGRLVSPTLQAHLRHIETNTQKDAANVRAALLKAGNNDAAWKQIASKSSLDPDTKTLGGDIGWFAPGAGDASIDLWAFASGRKAGDLSQPIKTSSGTWDIVQVIALDPQRVVDASALQAAKDNALAHWLSEQRANTSNTFSTPNAGMMSDNRNLPKDPNLNATLPQEAASPGALPGGVPAGGLPSGLGG
ncbi:MAG: peptidylprolyl isomerase [Ktedonobacterales bacterium]